MPLTIPRERLLSWWDGKPRVLLFDLVLALCVSVPVNIEEAPWRLPATLLAGLGLVVRRRFPGIAVATAVVAVAFGRPTLAGSIALYTFARRRGPVLSTWFACLVTVVAQLIVQFHPVQDWYGFPMLLGIAMSAALYGAPAILGLWLHQRQLLLSATHERIERAERERALLAERAVTDERRRIARELHDVIAHRASVLSLQAGALTMHARDKSTVDTAEVIRENSAKALTELRSMLHVLREGSSNHDDADGDAPTARDIEELVRDAVAGGSNIELTMPAVLPEIPVTIGRAAYRVVQEALTNAAQHAPDAAIRVDVEAGDDLVISVVNEPARKAGAGQGSGYGLLGMRERVALADGSLQAEATDDDGFRVRARLPVSTTNPD